MKSKIVVFKALAAVIAIVGAIASVSANSAFAVTSAYVHYTTASNAVNRTYCVKAGTCDAPGAFVCRVDVTIAGTVTQYSAKKGVSCATAQTGDTDNIADGSLSLPITATLIP